MTGLIDAWSIGVDIILDDKLTGQIAGVASQFDAVQTAIDNINAALRVTPGLIGGVTAALSGMAANFAAAAASARAIQAAMAGTAMPQAGGAYAVPTGGVYSAPPSPRTDFYGGSLGQLTTIPGEGTYTSGAGNNVPPAPPDEPFNQPRMPPINLGGGDDGHGNGVPWHQIFFGGMVLDVTGRLVSGGFNANATPQHIVTQMKGMSKDFSQDDAGQMVSAAYGLQQQYPGLSLTGAMTMLRDSYNLDRNVLGAIAMAQTMAQSAFILNSLGDQNSEDAIYSLMRSGELRALLNKKNPDGTPDLTAFDAFIAQQTQIAQGSGGRIDPKTAFGVFSMAGPEGILMDEEAAAKAEYLAQDLGPTRVGVGINALATEFLGGKMSQAAARRLHGAGLLSDDMFYSQAEVGQEVDGKRVTQADVGDVLKKYVSGLGYVLLPPGALQDQQGFKTDPLQWLSTVFEPAVAKLHPNDQAALLAGIYGDIGQITGSRVAADDIFQMAYLARQMSYLGNTTSVAQQTDNLKNDPATALTGFTTAFGAMVSAAASPLMPAAVAGLKELTGWLNDLSDYARAHPMQTAATDVELGLGAIWGVLKAGEKFFPNTKFWQAGGDVADFSATKVLGPIGLLAALVEQLHEMMAMPLPFTAAANAYQQNIKNGQPLGTPNDPLHVVVKNAGSTGPTMPHPAGPTVPPASQVLPFSGRQTR